MTREGSGSVSMQPVGCISWCFTDAGVVVSILELCEKLFDDGLFTIVFRGICTMCFGKE